MRFPPVFPTFPRFMFHVSEVMILVWRFHRSCFMFHVSCVCQSLDATPPPSLPSPRDVHPFVADPLLGCHVRQAPLPVPPVPPVAQGTCLGARVTDLVVRVGDLGGSGRGERGRERAREGERGRTGWDGDGGGGVRWESRETTVGEAGCWGERERERGGERGRERARGALVL